MPVEIYRDAMLKLVNTTSLNIRPAPDTKRAATGTLKAHHNGLVIGVRTPLEGQDLGAPVGNLWVPIYASFINAEGFVAAYYLDVPTIYVTSEELDALRARVEALEALVLTSV